MMWTMTLNLCVKEVNLRFRFFLQLTAVAGCALSGTALLHAAEDVVGNITRDALRMVACVKALDGPCSEALTYTKILEEQGLSLAEYYRKVAEVFGNLKAVGASYSKFDLAAPWPTFLIGQRTYAFVPYTYELLARGQTTFVQAFFVGVSDDGGRTWKFIDGVTIKPENVGIIIPRFGGGALPPRSLAQSPSLR
jgi:hypothetical protein